MQYNAFSEEKEGGVDDSAHDAAGSTVSEGEYSWEEYAQEVDTDESCLSDGGESEKEDRLFDW